MWKFLAALPIDAKKSLARSLGFVLLLHLLGWGLLGFFIVPEHYQVNGQIIGMGLGLTAYTLGMRHAFDADHIAAIDNSTRKLLNENRNAINTGFWFSLGHSSVVLVMVLLIGLGVKALASGISDQNSTLSEVTSIWGPTISGVFLILIGLINLSTLVGLLRIWRQLKRGEFAEADLNAQLANRGFLSRIFKKLNRAIQKPWHLMPLGFLFGLGFDTVTEIGLFIIAGGAVAADLPWWTVICLPILFAAGMSLWDTLDGALMNFAYQWAETRPTRKIYYNIVVTALSVAVAFLIGGIGLANLATEKWHLKTGPLSWLAQLDLNNSGYVIVGLFMLTWAGSVLFWRLGRFDQVSVEK